jgi:hypothetical protein
MLPAMVIVERYACHVAIIESDIMILFAETCLYALRSCCRLFREIIRLSRQRRRRFAATILAPHCRRNIVDSAFTSATPLSHSDESAAERHVCLLSSSSFAADGLAPMLLRCRRPTGACYARREQRRANGSGGNGTRRVFQRSQAQK